MKQTITKEQVFELKECQMNKIRKVIPWDEFDFKNIEFVLVSPTVDYFHEVPEGELEMPMLIPIDEMFG
jgi:hypothetical protein